MNARCSKCNGILNTGDFNGLCAQCKKTDFSIVLASGVISLYATGKSVFNFGEALKLLKEGKRLARLGWNGKNMFVVYQKSYPQGIPANKQTAEAWGINEGDLFKVEPYLQIKMANGSHAMWVPSINDVLAEDWLEA